jgi:membrane protein implicated in regulation of membrane protease activity
VAFEVVFWHWWALGAILLIVELLTPGMFFLWMAESAFAVGALLWLFPGMSIEAQVILFSVLSIASIALFRKHLRKHPIETDRPLLNRRAEQYVGRIFVLEEAIVNGRGKVRVGDTIWPVQGAEAAAGSQVRVVAAEGVVLRVEPARPVP